MTTIRGHPMKWIFALLMGVCVAAHAGDWTDSERNMFVLNETLLVTDWLQTRNIVKRPDIFYESNPILGRHPSMGAVNTFFAAQLVGSYYLADYLGKDRMLWLQINTVVRGANMIRNNSIGLTMRF